MKKHTVCRLCSSCCPVEVEIEGNRLVAAEIRSFSFTTYPRCWAANPKARWTFTCGMPAPWVSRPAICCKSRPPGGISA